jgi:hypothetical protein
MRRIAADGTGLFLRSENIAYSSDKFRYSSSGENEQEHTDEAKNHFTSRFEPFYVHGSISRIDQIEWLGPPPSRASS